jgi:sugar lactone lactonase YvrE
MISITTLKSSLKTFRCLFLIHNYKNKLYLFGLVILALSGCKDNNNDPDFNLPGVISTWAGTGQAGFNGDGNPIKQSSFYWPMDLAMDESGTFYVVDWNNHRIRKVTAENTFETVIGTDFVGDGPQDMADLVQPGTPGTRVNLNHPTHIYPLPDGTLVLTSWHNHKLRSYNPSTGLVYVMTGQGAGFDGDNGEYENALLRQPTQTITGPDGSYYILDQRNQRVRKIGTDGMITTVVGTGVAGFSGDGGSPLLAQINMPGGSNPLPGGALTLDDQGRLYISDVLNHRIRRVDFELDIIETIAGNGEAGFGGDTSAATNAALNNPRDIEIGPNGRLFIADEYNHRIRVVDLQTGIIDTYAGNGVAQFAGDGGQAKLASLNRPAGMEFDKQGNLYVADTYNHRIRKIIK